jgi:hypothetical protein
MEKLKDKVIIDVAKLERKDLTTVFSYLYTINPLEFVKHFKKAYDLDIKSEEEIHDVVELIENDFIQLDIDDFLRSFKVDANLAKTDKFIFI